MIIAFLRSWGGGDLLKGNLDDCSEFENSKVYVPIYKQFIEAGDLVVFAYRKADNKCIARACVQLHGKIVSEGSVERTLGRNEGYVHYVFCKSSDRGHGVHNNMINFICKYLKEYSLYAIVKENNTPSLKGFYRNGFKNIELLTQKNIVGFRKLVRKEIENEN